MKTAVQCDFDGTITEEDVSFLFLDEFVGSRWRDELVEYMEGRISVGAFNTKVFGMVRENEPALLDFMFKSGRVKVRPGFRELLDCCRRKNFRFLIVSNGLNFYINAILEDMGLRNVDVFAAESRFSPEGMEVRYIGPDGLQMETGLKEAYTRLLQKQGYRIVYAGNGVSDIFSARRAEHVFATGDLLESCRKENLACAPFSDLCDIVNFLETLEDS